jgi:tRNA modification GTPase
MTLDVDDLIAALASAPGPAARAILRVSGDGVREALAPVFTPDDEAAWRSAKAASRHPGRVTLREPAVSFPAAAYLWPNRRSYTGQPLAELHLPGSPPLVEATLAELYRQGIRPARPGEFTLRAFLAGKLDLVQAEAVLGVIDAADHRELDLALRQLAGGLSGRLADVRADLLILLADLEAGLDFVEEDIEFVSRPEVLRRAAAARDALDALLADASGRWRDAGRSRVVLAGLPNAGKSTLFNALAGSEQALVSPVAGTTRDWLAAELDLAGVPVELIDTAGWEAASDDLAAAMQSLRAEQLDRADLILWCTPAEADPATLAEDARLRAELGPARDRLIPVLTKSDLPDAPSLDSRPSTLVSVSASTGTGLDALKARLAAELAADRARSRQMVGSTAARGRESLAAARDALDRALAAARSGFGDEILAAELRAALDGLAAVLGTVYTDDVLDVVFSRFCIGK